MTVPPPPERDPRLRRHSMPTITRVRQLFAGGWSEREIQRLIVEEFGVRPAINSIRYWTDEKFRRQELRRRRQAGRGESPSPFRGPLSELTDGTLLALRIEDGLTYPTIAKVVRRFYGEDIRPDALRHHLNALGVPKNPKKSRANQARAAA
jgi:hypothetical protein